MATMIQERTAGPETFDFERRTRAIGRELFARVGRGRVIRAGHDSRRQASPKGQALPYKNEPVRTIVHQPNGRAGLR
jgi:hypothetical protein